MHTRVSSYSQISDPPLYIAGPADSADRDHILIVDDSVTVRKAISKHLSPMYVCHEAETVIEAQALLRAAEYAVVIADIRMPGLSGIELLRKIIDEYPETPVIMISGIDRPQRVLDAVRLGAFDYMIKPCDMDILELTVERAVERRNLLRSARKYKADLEARNLELAHGKAQLERLQAEIVQNAKMASLGQLASGVAHELNNPAGFVYGNIDHLQDSVSKLVRLLRFYDEREKGPADPTLRQLKDEIGYEDLMSDLDSIIADCREGAERIREIVQNLRIFSRLDEAEFAKTDVHEGIDSTVRLLSTYFTSEKIVLVRDYGDLPSIEAYPGQLNQVWMNLLVNAAQAVSETGGEVRVRTRTEGDSVIISIADTGHGIAAQNIDRIFDPFFTTKPVGEGTGLGLSISFGIVEKHAGNIQVRSRPGEGSEFAVTLPIRAAESAATAAEV